VSRKVRQLDVAQSRVNKTLTHITATVGRTEAVDGLRRALAADDFEAAATHIAQFRDLEARFVSGAAAAAVAEDRQMAEQHDAVRAARAQLAATIHARLEVASRVGDHDAVDRFIRLYNPLDMEVRGRGLWFGRGGRGSAGVGRRSGGVAERKRWRWAFLTWTREKTALPAVDNSPMLTFPPYSLPPSRKALPGSRPICGNWWQNGRRRLTRRYWKAQARAGAVGRPSSTP